LHKKHCCFVLVIKETIKGKKEMKSNFNKITKTSAIALTATIMTGVNPLPASAQVIELLSIAGTALSSLANSNRNNQQLLQQQQYQQYYRPTTQSSEQIPNRTWTVGTGNLNSNNFTFCLATCNPATPQTSTASSGVRTTGYTGYPVTSQTNGYSQYPNGVSTQQTQQMGTNGYSQYPNGVSTQQTQQMGTNGYSQYPNGVVNQQQMTRTGYPVTTQTGQTGMTTTTGYPTQTTTQQTSRPRPTLSIPNIQLQF
jgi:hypothetical protein